jgi:hypothetical protein
MKATRAKKGTGIVSAPGDPLDQLPIYKRNYVKVRAEGGSVKEAAAAAGVTPRQGRKYDRSPDIQAAYRSLMQKAIPAQKLVNLIKSGCEAKMPVYSSDGKKVSERADWKTRRGYIEMASKHAGYYVEATANSPVGIQVLVQHIGQRDGNTERSAEITAEAVRAS